MVFQPLKANILSGPRCIKASKGVQGVGESRDMAKQRASFVQNPNASPHSLSCRLFVPAFCQRNALFQLFPGPAVGQLLTKPVGSIVGFALGLLCAAQLWVLVWFGQD